MGVKRVLVVGGGSAGWSAAAYLNAALNRDGEKNAEIALLESPEAPRIGVGEATIPNITHILSVIGIDEHDFMRSVDATFKQSIRFVTRASSTTIRSAAIGDHRSTLRPATG